MLAGLLGGAVGTPGLPVILYASAQGWSRQLFFVASQAVILAGYWWAGLLTVEVGRRAVALAGPGVVGLTAGMALFARVDPVLFRRIVFAIVLLSGVALLVRG